MTSSLLESVSGNVFLNPALEPGYWNREPVNSRAPCGPHSALMAQKGHQPW